MQRASASGAGTIVVEEGKLISQLGDQRFASFTPTGPSDPTLGFALTDFDLSLSSLEELPLTIAPDVGNSCPLGAPPVVGSSDLVLFRGNSPKQDSYEDLCVRSFISSLLFQKPKVPPAAHVPFSFLGEPNTKISHTTPELELTLWVPGLSPQPVVCG